MSSYATVFAIVSSLLTLSAAVDCSGKLCLQLEDETSLLQVNQLYHPSKDAAAIELLKRDAIEVLVETASEAALAEAEADEDDKQLPLLPREDDAMAEIVTEQELTDDAMADSAMTDSRAILDAHNDAVSLDEGASGAITMSWKENLNRAKAEIIANTADRLEFTNKVRSERQADEKETDDQLAADQRAIVQSLETDGRAVRDAFDRRIRVQKNANRKIEAAKQAWEAHVIKKRQAQTAAAVGQQAGQQEGADDSARAMNQWEDAVLRAAAIRRDAQGKAAEARNIADQRAAVDRQTADQHDGERALVASDQAEVRAMTARGQANAAQAETAINGPEDMNNVLTDHSADRYEERMGRRAGRDEQAIDDYADARIPIDDAAVDYLGGGEADVHVPIAAAPAEDDVHVPIAAGADVPAEADADMRDRLMRILSSVTPLP